MKESNYQVKQVLIFRKDLKVRKGKLAAQMAHASLAAILNRGNYKLSGDKTSFRLNMKNGSPMHIWLTGSFAKICVYVENEEELLELYEQVKDTSIPHALITDAGHTEFHGIPTKTALAIGPERIEVVDKITGHLKLL